jgi:hypothetical protein
MSAFICVICGQSVCFSFHFTPHCGIFDVYISAFQVLSSEGIHHEPRCFGRGLFEFDLVAALR